MLKRTLAALFLSLLATTGAATAQSWSDLQVTSVLHLDKLPPWIEDSRRFAEYQHDMVKMAERWLVEQGHHLEADGPIVKLPIPGHGFVAVFDTRGPDVTVVFGQSIERPDRERVDVTMTVLFERSLRVDVPNIYNGI
ncbi:MAG TPA: hypothetical protein VEL74_22950 [Thermoanaerobaculia bacterium]|nr:hypothetical protein [Thermoanaerobaculia bacterium]